ncbi:MAG: ATP-dependent protease [Campylobacteraceae bacterium 4484_4]|nr:MAG: ATP-dependent protease [Campylobacteraceae bacterium 4484_4]
MAEILTVEQIYKSCSVGVLGFKTTDQVSPLEEIIGQKRALDAIRFGIGIERKGYNLYAMGNSGVGKHTVIERTLKKRAKRMPTPSDWCYVNNFEDPRKPIVLEFTPGRGKVFQKDMEKLVDLFQSVVPALFESDEYRQKKQAILDRLNQIREAYFSDIQKRAREDGIAIRYSMAGYTMAPLTPEGKVMPPEMFQALTEEEKARIQERIKQYRDEIESVSQKLIKESEETQKELKSLEEGMIKNAVGDMIEKIKEKYQDHPRVIAYLEKVEEDMVLNAEYFLQIQQGPMMFTDAMQKSLKRSGVFIRYQVNLLVSHKEEEGAAVIYEDNPTFANIFGRIEYISYMGTLVTNFSLIKPGALHRANGGYLILDARKVLTEPFVWDGLKRMVRSGEIRIEALSEKFSLMSTVSLEPETIPLNVKIVLVGERLLYYLLSNFDPEFKELFKVTADFEERMDRSEEAVRLYGEMIATIAQEEKLLPLDGEATCRVIEQSSRLVSDSEKLSTHLQSIVDLLEEADFIARESGSKMITKDKIEAAIEAKRARSSRIEEEIFEEIKRDTLMIDTAGEVVGQINGISVVEMGDITFGRPVRITARTRLGKGAIVDIEREVKLGGPIHSKGVMILSSYLASRYAREFRLSLTATLVFEQSYGPVEGDSASAAELYTLLSSLSDLPLNQSVAVTGSVNQNGEIQAVGGINEKIEGFFDICRLKKEGKKHGVMIPSANVKHLMLKREVREAVEKGEFTIYAISHIDEGMEVMLGRPAGERDKKGKFPKESVNALVEAKLKRFSKKAQMRRKERAGDEEK